MNPSSAGWIPKFIYEFEKKELSNDSQTLSQFYKALKRTGFLYGFSVKTLLKEPISTLKLTKEELTKVNLFHSLLAIYNIERPQGSSEEAIKLMVSFYQSLEKGKPGFFRKLSFTKSSSDNLERIISSRLQESNALIKTEVATLFTYALLFADVLAFQHYLRHPKGLKKYLETLEETLIQFSIWALQSKKKKNKYDLLVIEMVEESSQFLTSYQNTFQHDLILQLRDRTILEKQFVLDICCLAIWDDKQIDSQEIVFLKHISESLLLPNSNYENSIKSIKVFSEKNAQKINLFQYNHPVKQLYKQSTETVKLLILRNKNRLMKELMESGELVKLLSQSTLRELSPEEKHKVKDQLLDICKSIPSLTIFMLPGGSLLLPILVKLIPKLLPSAFHENRVDE
ncbi:MAG: hypothetical protein CL596_04220 [Alteromonas sp.]|nr:hypothetical protein [Alteromonas sp.]MAY23623.1 hypothetical protein [Flavobacteriaceae bacterium]|tara:strand:- start:38 stop:1234 length:1197 start_codon:yes stop_codon:yes gene_type:complete